MSRVLCRCLIVVATVVAFPEFARSQPENTKSKKEKPVTIASAGGFEVAFHRQMEPHLRKANITCPVPICGMGYGAKQFTRGGRDIMFLPRHLKITELRTSANNGIEFVEAPIAIEAIVLAVGHNNEFVDQLTIEEVRSIFLDSRRAIKWSDVRKEWPTEKILLSIPGTDSGTFDFFKQVVAGKEHVSIRDDCVIFEDGRALTDFVAKNEFSICFVSRCYFETQELRLKPIAVENSDGDFVLPSEENLSKLTYEPFSRIHYIYLNRRSLKRDSVTRFAEIFLDNYVRFNKNIGFTSLDQQTGMKVAEQIRAKIPGTHFFHPEGSAREGDELEVFRQVKTVSTALFARAGK